MRDILDFYVAGHALIHNKGKYLITRRSSLNDYQPLKWDIPGGEMAPGETLEEVIHREVMEETQLQIEILRVIHVYTNRDQLPKGQTIQVIYLCENIRGEIRLNPSEHDIFKWIKYQEIANHDLISFLADLTKKYTPLNNA